MRHRFAFITSILCGCFALTLSAVSAEPLPRPLSDKDAGTYRQIFALQEDGDIKAATKLIKTLDSDLLMGHVLSQKYLHPTAWRSSFKELSNWLADYNDHPAASRIKWLSDRRKPKKAKAAKAPKPGYLNGWACPDHKVIGHQYQKAGKAGPPPGAQLPLPKKSGALSAGVTRPARLR